MTGPYDITMIHNDLKRHYHEAHGVGLTMTSSAGDMRLVLDKGDDYKAWISNDIPVHTAGGVRPINEANRAYLHYVIDCWLDEVEPTKAPGDIA